MVHALGNQTSDSEWNTPLQSQSMNLSQTNLLNVKTHNVLIVYEDFF